MKDRVKAWVAMALCVAGLALPVWVLHRSEDAGFGPVLFLFSGRAFAERPMVTGAALDQFGLHKEFFIFCYSLVVLCPFLVLVRRLSRSVPQGLRVVLVSAALITLAHPFSVLTIFSWDVIRYVYRMGVTPMRMAGFLVALVAYGALTFFAAWLAGLRIRWPRQASHAISEPAPSAVSSARERQR